MSGETDRAVIHRVGLGTDLHRLAAGRRLVLGHVTVPHDRGPAAHSDGDVVLHAIIDALAGAAGLPDIGEMFPDTEPAWRDADSAILLAETLRRVTEAGYAVVNVDATIHAQQPRLSPYKAAIRAEVARLMGKAPTDAIFDLLLDEEGSVPAVYFLMSEEDVQTAMKIPWVSIGSDGSAVRPDGPLAGGKPHPRWYGTFPRVLGKYVREDHVLTLEEAVKKMTYLNAEKLGLADRGLLKEGLRADITVFDAQRVVDRATFQNPHQYPVGIEYVAVNGVLVLENEQHLGKKPGLVLRRLPPP